MANTSQMRVVTGLPQFSGFPRPNETFFKSEVTAKFFIEALENYFDSHEMINEEAKMSLFYNMIDHTKGDALTLIPCFKGAKLKTFSEIKDQFLAFYDSGKQTEFQPAAKQYMKINLQHDTKENLTRLNNITKNIAEAYLSSKHYLGEDYNINNTIIINELINHPPAEIRYNIGAKGPIKLVSVLQNLLMHTVIAANTHKGVAEYLREFGPDIPSTKLMTYANKSINDNPSPENEKIIEKNEDTVWKATTQNNNNSTQSTPRDSSRYRPGTPRDNSRYIQSTPNNSRYTQGIPRDNYRYTHPNRYPQTPRTQYREDRSPICSNCNRTGHVKRECRCCTYCKRAGHTARLCETRKRIAKGKFCSNCKIHDSHDTSECYRGARNSRVNNPRNVRILREYPDDEKTSSDDDWSPNNYDDRDDYPPQT